MQNRKVLISLIIPCKNSELNIKKTLSSLETQNSTFEVIFVYTESSDKTLSILRNFQNKFIKKKNYKKKLWNIRSIKYWS